MNKQNLTKLIFKLYKMWEDYDMKEGTDRTWCNYFVTSLLMEFNYLTFNHGNSVLSLSDEYPMTANEICEVVEEDKEYWTEVSDIGIKEFVTSDYFPLILAVSKGETHGHVAPLIPGQFISSGKWNKEVPLCANIGSKNAYAVGVNMCFKTEPRYFKFKGEL